MDEAREVLGVDMSATPAEIRDAFHQRVRESHPDAGGNSEEFRRICDARDLLATAEASRALVPFADVRELVVKLTTDISAQEERRALSAQTESVVRSVVRVYTTRSRRLRRKLNVLLMAVAVIAASTQAVRLIPSPTRNTLAIVNIVTLTLGIFAAFAATGVAILTSQLSTVQNDIEDMSQTLDDKALVAQVIQQIFESNEAMPPWTLEGWRTAVRQWARNLRLHPDPDLYTSTSLGPYIRRIGHVEFARIVYAKAKEQQLITETEVWRDDRLQVTFDLNRSIPQ